MKKLWKAVEQTWQLSPLLAILAVAAIIGLAISFTPQKWIDGAKKRLSRGDVIGPKSPKKSVADCIADLSAERVAIAAERDKLEKRERALAEAEAQLMMVKGVSP